MCFLPSALNLDPPFLNPFFSVAISQKNKYSNAMQSDQTMSTSHHIISGLARIGIFLRSQDWKKAEQTDLTATQSQILSQLASRGPARVGSIAEGLAVAQPTATTAIGTLVRKGLIEKRADPEDARAAQLHLTRSGVRKARAISGWPEALTAAVDELDDSERAGFLRSLTSVIRSLQRQQVIPVQRMCATCVHFRPNVHDDPNTPHHCDFVNAAFGDAQLRLDCGDHESLSEPRAVAVWQRFVDFGSANETDAPSAATDEAS